MSDYSSYNNSRMALTNLIQIKEEQITELNNDISVLKKTLYMLDRDFIKNIKTVEIKKDII